VAAGITKEDGSPQMAKASGPVRVAVTGRRVGPPLWESLEALGADRTLARLGAARGRLG
jgi:glutamyl-tRNA synthetase